MTSSTFHFSKIFFAVSLASLSAGCDISSSHTTSEFAPVDATSAMIIGSSLDNRLAGSARNSQGGGYAYELGGKDGKGLIARSGIIPGTSVSDLPASGSAQMSGAYEVAAITSVIKTSRSVSGFAIKSRGVLTLNADFAANTLSGTSNNGRLVVSGKFADKALSGTVAYSGTGGELSGLVGAKEAIGVFHGNSDDAIFSGGFIVEE